MFQGAHLAEQAQAVARVQRAQEGGLLRQGGQHAAAAGEQRQPARHAGHVLRFRLMVRSHACCSAPGSVVLTSTWDAGSEGCSSKHASELEGRGEGTAHVLEDVLCRAASNSARMLRPRLQSRGPFRSNIPASSVVPGERNQPPAICNTLLEDDPSSLHLPHQQRSSRQRAAA